MSWNSIQSRDQLSVPSHQLSVTRLLSSPESGRHSFQQQTDRSEFCPFSDEISHIGNHGSAAENGDVHFRFGSRFGPTYYYSSTSVFDCFNGCRSKLEEYYARRQMYRAIRLYERNKQTAAVKIWLNSLKSMRNRNDKFILLGYLYTAYMDSGKYRDSIEFAHRQLTISEELDSAIMRADAYLNLSMAHQIIGGLDRALSYARHALYNDCGGGGTVSGNVHLIVAFVSLELGTFSKSMESFQKAMSIAQNIGDNTLLLQVYVGVSRLWLRLRDSSRSAACAAKAADLSRRPRGADLNTRYHRLALLQMASSLRARGDLADASDYCNVMKRKENTKFPAVASVGSRLLYTPEEALRLSSVAGDQGNYARAVRIAGDIYRKKCDIAKALRHYEIAMGAGQSLGDRLVQMESMDGAARCLEVLRKQGKICNCRPLEFNTRLLEVATSVGAKVLVRIVRLRLCDIYQSLGDTAGAERMRRAAVDGPYPLCAVCSRPLITSAEENTNLTALQCAHITHTSCAGSSPVTCVECTKPCQLQAPPTPPPPPPIRPQQYPGIQLPLSLQDSDLNSILSDSSSHQVTSSV